MAQIGELDRHRQHEAQIHFVKCRTPRRALSILISLLTVSFPSRCTLCCAKCAQPLHIFDVPRKIRCEDELYHERTDCTPVISVEGLQNVELLVCQQAEGGMQMMALENRAVCVRVSTICSHAHLMHVVRPRVIEIVHHRSNQSREYCTECTA
eukprot:3842471-Prymnesium_polylepis.1